MRSKYSIVASLKHFICNSWEILDDLNFSWQFFSRLFLWNWAFSRQYSAFSNSHAHGPVFSCIKAWEMLLLNQLPYMEESTDMAKAAWRTLQYFQQRRVKSCYFLVVGHYFRIEKGYKNCSAYYREHVTQLLRLMDIERKNLQFHNLETWNFEPISDDSTLHWLNLYGSKQWWRQ